MTPRKFDRYMVSVGAGTHPKFARLTDGERCAHFLGVLAVAAMSPIRGRLLIGRLPAEPVDIARAAGVPVRVAASAMRKLEAVGVLCHDDEHDCLRVHDWDDINPPPKTDASNAERQRQFRARNADRNADRNGHVTPSVTTPEVEVEVEVGGKPPKNTNAELRSAVIECFAYWQDRCDHGQASLSADRKAKLETRLRERAQLGGGTPRAIRDVRQAIDGAARHPYIDPKGKRFDDIELICRTGSKLEDFMGRAELPPAGLRVVPGGNASPDYLIRKLNESEAL